MSRIEDDLAAEDSIVWLRDPKTMSYVRERWMDCNFRTRLPVHDLTGDIVGYSTVKIDSYQRRGKFMRRIFWLKPYDRPNNPKDCYGIGGCPAEGVDPLTVRPGVAGVKNDRAVGNSRVVSSAMNVRESIGVDTRRRYAFA